MINYLGPNYQTYNPQTRNNVSNLNASVSANGLQKRTKRKALHSAGVVLKKNTANPEFRIIAGVQCF